VLEAQMGFNAPESFTMPVAATLSAPQDEDDIATISRRLLDLVSETPVHRDDLFRLSGAQTFIGLAALSELEITGRLTAGDGGFYSRT
jgi:predicted Rossmann fold nucleotide-binding protein DprA/Smf involved in DNA uptake